jgi:glycosyltransferase involved in cell wall biosynthesis
VRADAKPKVSIGLPVYNGERFVAAAIESVLGQTFAGLELVISDNASTDRTEEICRDYAARDTRVRYSRNSSNIGVNPNFRRVFRLARAEYFKWVAHDDLQTADFLEKAVPVLDSNPHIVVCYPRVAVINERGEHITSRSYGLDPDLARNGRPQDRLEKILWINWGSPPIYGLMRSSVLARTPLLATTYAADQVLLAELALHGGFHELPEELLLHREHANRSVHVNPSRLALMRFQDPSNSTGVIFPAWRVMRDYFAAVNRAPLDWHSRMTCRKYILRWAKYHRSELFEDLSLALGRGAARKPRTSP